MIPSEPPSQFVSAILERWERNSSKKFLTLNFKTYAKIRFLSTGGNGSGAPIPRNIGLDAAGFEYSAILDAYDQMPPQKIEFAVAQLQHHPIISCVLQLLTKEYKHLRMVGAGADRILTGRDYKFTNFSSDLRLVDDRRIADPRFAPRLSSGNWVETSSFWDGFILQYNWSTTHPRRWIKQPIRAKFSLVLRLSQNR